MGYYVYGLIIVGMIASGNGHAQAHSSVLKSKDKKALLIVDPLSSVMQEGHPRELFKRYVETKDDQEAKSIELYCRAIGSSIQNLKIQNIFFSELQKAKKKRYPSPLPSSLEINNDDNVSSGSEGEYSDSERENIPLSESDRPQCNWCWLKCCACKR